MNSIEVQLGKPRSFIGVAYRNVGHGVAHRSINDLTQRQLYHQSPLQRRWQLIKSWGLNYTAISQLNSLESDLLWWFSWSEPLPGSSRGLCFLWTHHLVQLFPGSWSYLTVFFVDIYLFWEWPLAVSTAYKLLKKEGPRESDQLPGLPKTVLFTCCLKGASRKDGEFYRPLKHSVVSPPEKNLVLNIFLFHFPLHPIPWDVSSAPKVSNLWGSCYPEGC